MGEKIILIGYMASGKSLIGNKLAKILNYSFIDLDQYIEDQEQKNIAAIFLQKGELYFRKKEHFYLEEVLSKNEKIVLATGGGTPCYSNNISLIKKNLLSNSIFLKASLETIVGRLENERHQRPLIAHLKTKEELSVFIRKHLFERNPFYTQAKFIVNANDKASKTLEKIIIKLF